MDFRHKKAPLGEPAGWSLRTIGDTMGVSPAGLDLLYSRYPHLSRKFALDTQKTN